MSSSLPPLRALSKNSAAATIAFVRLERLVVVHGDRVLARHIFNAFAGLDRGRWLEYYLMFLEKAIHEAVVPEFHSELYERFLKLFEGHELPREYDFFDGCLNAVNGSEPPPTTQWASDVAPLRSDLDDFPF